MKRLISQWRQLSALTLPALFCLFGTCGNVNADTLDTNFGAFGAVELNVSHYDGFREFKVDSDGSIYVLGFTKLDAGVAHNLLLARYKSDGSIDHTFGGFGGAPAGTVVTDIQRGFNFARGLAIADDGKILVLSENSMIGWVVCRYNANGWLDHSFGNLGKKVLGNENQEILQGMEIVNGKIVIWSSGRVIRLTANGSLDNFFGSGGTVMFENIVGQEVVVTDAVVSASGMTFAGYLYEGFIEDPGEVRLFRLNVSGSKRFSFGNAGVISLSGVNGVVSGLVTNDDEITIGVKWNVMKFDSEGVFNNEFGIGGIVDLGVNASVKDIVLQPYGLTTVLLDGNAQAFVNEYMAVRLESDGALESTFGNQIGWYRQAFGEQALPRQIFGYANGKVLIAGDYFLPQDGPRNLMLVRTETFDWFQNGGGGQHWGGGDKALDGNTSGETQFGRTSRQDPDLSNRTRSFGR